MSSAASSADLHPGARPTGPVIALVAGEASGDQLGAALITALQERFPDACFVGVGGDMMKAAGLNCWRSSDELAVMGLFEVLAHLPRLIRLRRYLAKRLIAERPDILIGVDAPDFNLGLERRVRAAGIATAHFVSPTVWAWRSGRVRKIARSTERVLCLFPFEPGFYSAHGVPAHYTGHPMADAIPRSSDPAVARSQLGLSGPGPFIALLPGSRLGEVSRLARPLLGTARILTERHPEAQFIVPMASDAARRSFEEALSGYPGLPLTLLDGQARRALAAADVVVCASGTAALETLLVNRPMVVVYRLSHLTYLVGKALRLLKSRFFSLPNILADERLVPELLQFQAEPRRIAAEVDGWLDAPERVRVVSEAFSRIHEELRRDAARTGAAIIHDHLRPGVQ